MRDDPNSGYALHKAFISGSPSRVDARLRALGAAFDAAEDGPPESASAEGFLGGVMNWRHARHRRLAAAASEEAGHVFEQFCHMSVSGNRALVILRAAGRILSQASLRAGMARAAGYADEDVMREALPFIHPADRAEALRECALRARFIPNSAFASSVESWAQAVEDQHALENIPPSMGSASAQPTPKPPRRL